MISEEIPIQNIYYMLSYAYKNLKINENVLKDSISYDNVYNLFARILINILKAIKKRGFYKGYISKNDNLHSPKGKINISESIKTNSLVNKQLNCQFDEFSENVLFNQIIKTTMENLIRNKNVDKSLKKDLKKFLPFFKQINTIDLNDKIFHDLTWNRNNSYYSLAITICELIYTFKLPEDSLKGEILFKDFIKNYEKELAHLYENFVFNFFKNELKDVKVYKPHIYWNLGSKQDCDKYLPIMKTDIVLENSHSQLIIDTKFYKNFLEKGKLNSANLYQISSYIANSDFKGEVEGMLLYASLGEDINLEYNINGKKIYIKTLDLNQDWQLIDSRLREIADLI